LSRIRVAIADDSSFIRKAVARMLSESTEIEMVGLAARGEELLDNLERWAPDVILLDLSMPGIGGLLALDEIMARRPVPVIILSTHSRQGAPMTIEALHRGATDFLDKQQYSLVDFDALRQALVGKILEVSRRDAGVAALLAVPPPHDGTEGEPEPPELIVIGASTGGPPAIEQLLRELGGEIPVPILIVQHMPPGFTRAFADRLNAHLALTVREAEDGEALHASTVYIAPGGIHLRVGGVAGTLRVSLAAQPEKVLHRPSVDVLFASAGRVLGARVVAVLLTGMGQDGAEGMLSLVRRGAHTIAQDEATSIIFGMPRAALLAGAVREILPLPAIGGRLRQLVAGARIGVRS
jgi:two-component system chemotaxis response regulator CheB